MKKTRRRVIPWLIISAIFLTGCVSGNMDLDTAGNPQNVNVEESINLSDIPEFAGEPYVVINNNEPSFVESDLTETSFEMYSSLDNLGRCRAAFANIGENLMPTEKRGSIGQVKPSGWQTIKYDHVDGKYLYNRCHLIGYQLTAENANEKNLITGTRYLNIEGMLPFENMVADYVKETGNHTLYRVTPIYDGNNPVASGVQMEGKSVEDNGEGICFNVYAYNNQPGTVIDYSTGESSQEEMGTAVQKVEKEQIKKEDVLGEKAEAIQDTYIANTNTKKFHKPSCSSVKTMKESNRKEVLGERDGLINQGYEPCQNCNP